MPEIQEAIMEVVAEKIELALEETVVNIINEELPTGASSPIADKLKSEKLSNTHFQIIATSRVWAYLNFGTGIYNPSFAGAGPGGIIIPTSGAKSLHFKNTELAAALGFKDENIFLRSVKGIKPRYFFERHLETSRFQETVAKQ